MQPTRAAVPVALLAALFAPMACASGAPRPEVARGAVEPGPRGGLLPDRPPPREAERMLAEISSANLERTVAKLAGFGTRHTLSETDSPARGIGAARQWIKSELERIAAGAGRAGAEAMQVAFDAHRAGPDGRRLPRQVEIVNVVAVLPGTSAAARQRRFYVVGHYDSRASDPMDAKSDAPGANDDASGVAVVMELARVLSTRRIDATLVFLATAGEEQGLYGARLHARAARAAGADIRAVLNNDIVGDPSSPRGTSQRGRIRLFSEALPVELAPEELQRIRGLGAENDSPSRQLARYVAEVAAWHRTPVQPMLVYRPDRFGRGGDHTAFTELGFPAVRLTVVDEHYDRQHQDVRTVDGKPYGDVPRFIDPAYLAGVAAVNGAALMHLANAPAPPGDARLLSAPSVDVTLRWSPSPDGDVAGYEVVWRETTSPTWQQARDVGAATEATLPLNKDNFFFGVRAYDRDGYRSIPAFPHSADR